MQPELVRRYELQVERVISLWYYGEISLDTASCVCVQIMLFFQVSQLMNSADEQFRSQALVCPPNTYMNSCHRTAINMYLLQLRTIDMSIRMLTSTPTQTQYMLGSSCKEWMFCVRDHAIASHAIVQ